MAKNIRVKINSKGAVAVLKSPEVQAMLLERARRSAAAAGGEPDFEASVTVGKNRARASVITATHAGRLAEAKDRKLTKALDAARG